VLPVARPARVARPAAEPPPAPRAPWKVGLVVFVVLAAAYLGVYELLTAEAKRDRDRLLALHGPAITTFPDPGPPQVVVASSLRDYTKARARYEDRRSYEGRVSRIDAMFVGLMAAFAAQTLLTAVLLLKSALARRAAGARARARTARAA